MPRRINMDRFKTIWNFIKEIYVLKDTILGISGLSAIFISIASFISDFGLKYFIFIKNHIQAFLYAGFGLLSLSLFLNVLKLRNKMFLGYKANLKEPLDQNWEIMQIPNEHTEWELDNNELIVSHSHYGGITKKGSFWEDYDFCFSTKIINKQTSWIVRAKDPFDYMMFQCNGKTIVPHRLHELVTVVKNNGQEITEKKLKWDITEGIPIPDKKQFNNNEWVKIKISVRGHKVKIFSDNTEVYHKTHTSMNLYGRVGFRNCTEECARFRDIKVIIK